MRTTIWGPLAGIVFAVLFFVGLILLNLPDGDDATIRSFYEDSGNRTRVVIIAYLLAVAGLAFIIFLSDLQARLRTAEAPATLLSNIASVSGVVFVAMLFGGGAAFAAIAAGMTLGGEPATLGDTGVSRFLTSVGYGMLLVYGALSVALMIFTTSILGLRTKVLPNWLNGLGIVAALLLLIAVIFIPMIALPVWVLAASIVLLMRRS